MSDEASTIDCPKCGCNDSRVIKTGTRWGQPTERRRCNHCGHAWAQTQQGAAGSRGPVSAIRAAQLSELELSRLLHQLLRNIRKRSTKDE